MTLRLTGLPWRVQGRVRHRARSSDAEILQRSVDGLEATAEGPAFKARVRAVPEDGEANAAFDGWWPVARRAEKRACSVTAGQVAGQVAEHRGRRERHHGAAGAAARQPAETERAARYRTNKQKDWRDAT